MRAVDENDFAFAHTGQDAAMDKNIALFSELSTFVSPLSVSMAGAVGISDPRFEPGVFLGLTAC
jgi:hypothetical protein